MQIEKCQEISIDGCPGSNSSAINIEIQVGVGSVIGSVNSIIYLDSFDRDVYNRSIRNK